MYLVAPAAALATAALALASPALAQTMPQSTSPTSPTTGTTTPPSSTTPPVQNPTTQQAPVDDTTSTSPMTPSPTTPDPSSMATTPPAADAADPAGGYMPAGPALQGTAQPGARVVVQPSMSPAQAFPPPPPLDSYPICKRGQYDNCRQRGG